MHAALPKAQQDIGNGRWKAAARQRLAKPALLVLAVLMTVMLLVSFYGTPTQMPWNAKVYYKGGIKANAETVETSQTPYIYPNFADLESYRNGQWLRLNRGKDDEKWVQSKKHSIIYNGGQSPKVVLIVGLDDSFGQEHLENVVQDRLNYAERHGFGLYARYLKDFASPTAEKEGDNTEFSKVLMIQEAMYAFQGAGWIWWLDQDAVITNHEFNIEHELLTPQSLDGKMIRDAPIMPPESIIHTYKRVPAQNIKFVISQNDRGMSTSSFIVRNDQLYGKVFMGYWSDPLHRSYSGFTNYRGLNGHIDASLTHMVQWHPVILSRMAVVKPKYLGSRPNEGEVLKNQKFEKNDFVYMVRDSNEGDAPGTDEIVKEWNRAKKEYQKS